MDLVKKQDVLSFGKVKVIKPQNDDTFERILKEECEKIKDILNSSEYIDYKRLQDGTLIKN